MRMQRLCLAFLAFVGVIGMGTSAWADSTVVAPTAFNFNDVVVGGSANTTFTITVNDTASDNVITVSAITPGANCGDFSFTPAFPNAVYTDIQDATPVTVTVTFAPTTRGSRTCRFTLTENSGDADAETFDATGNGVSAIISPSPTTLLVGGAGGVLVGTTSTASDVTVDNNGETDLTVTSMSITGTNHTMFSFASKGCTGQTCDTDFTVLGAVPDSTVVSITCTPSAPFGNKTATLNFVSNTVGGTSAVTLNCTALERIISLNPSGTLAIGDVRLGSFGSGNVLVDNTGNTDLTIADMQITGGDASQFTFRDHGCVGSSPSCVPSPGFVVTPAETPETVSIRCTPTSLGAKSVTLTFNSDSGGNETVTVTCNGTQSNLGLNPATALAFGSVHIGSTSSAANVRVTNPSGTATLNVTSMSISGANADQFRFNGGAGCNTQTCTVPFSVDTSGTDFEDVPIVCAPTAPRTAKTALLTLTSDSATPVDNTVDLTCTATAPRLVTTVAADPLPCGSTAVNGGSSTCTFTITNPGPAANDSNETLDWTVTSNTPGEYLVSAGGAPGISVSGTTAVDGVTVITVTFNPSAGGTRGGTITVSADDPGNVSDTVNVTGTGTVPTITNILPDATAPHVVNLADTDITVGPATTSTATTISLQNLAGGAPLQITAVGFVGGNLAQFAFTGTGAQTVAAGGTASWNVTCTPLTPFGNKTTTFRVTHDAPGGTPGTNLDFTLNCLGLQASYTVTGTLAFGSVLENTTAMDSVVINNIGNRAGTLDVTSPASSLYVPTVSGGFPTTIAAGGNVTLDVAFTPINGDTTNVNLLAASTTAAAVPLSFNIPVTGDGIHEGFEVTIAGEASAGMVALGDVRVLTLVTRNVTMQNTSDVPINLTSAPQSNDSECVVQLGTPGAYPVNNLAPGATATFTIRVTPAAIGGGTCTISMAGLIPSTATPLAEMTIVTWNGVAPEVTLLAPTNGAALDFAGVDIDATPIQLPVQVQNSGEFALAVTSCSITGAQAAKFVAPSCAGTIQPDGDSIFMITYDPTIESIDGATLSLVTDAFPVGLIQVELAGVGVDQHINLPSLVYEFPDTFRNPDEAPTRQIVVEDPLDLITGQAAPLTISMAISDESQFVLPDTGPFTVQPGADIDIPVEFRPTAYGSFTGTVTIMNDTTGNPMAEVQLTGDGVSRNVTVSPGDFDLGLTGVNVPILLSDVQDGGITVTNIDPLDLAYTVRELALVDSAGDPIAPEDTPFTLIADGDLALAADGTLTYDAEFSPTEEGEYEVTVAVYLDNDPEAHALVTLHGTAVEVELRGGGCQAGGNAGSGGLVVMALGLLALPWRRRRAVLAVAIVLALAGVAAAQPTRNVDISTFSPAPATEVGGFAVETSTVGVSGAWALDLMFSHATNVLMVTSPSAAAAGMEADTPVSARTSVQLGFAYAFLDRFEGGLRVPIYQQTGTMPQFSGLQPADGTALGDVAAHGKASLLDTGSVAFGASLDVTVPTATDGQFAGVDGPTAQVRALGGWRVRRFGVNVNAGFLGRGISELGNIEQGNALTFGAGAWVRALDAMYVIGEGFGSSGMGDNGVLQAEAVLGVRYEIARSIGVSAGAGRGLIHGIGSPDVRGFVLVDIAPKAREAEPLVIIIPPPPKDARDDDGDGVINADDKCLEEAEDPDEFADDDGCADKDNDEDGLYDVEDKCPLEKEDVDAHLDEDGCVDTDNDVDGILDLDDKCPNEAEDKDGYLDSDGCDEVDNDGDGIPDVIDQCALEQETINGNNDDDGCPDIGDSLVMVMPDRIEIFEPVTFTAKTATLTKKSANVLGQVAATMRANRDFKRLRVTVHVHPRDGDDQKLSNDRAKAVRDWLVKWGIEPERVEQRGLGSTRPLVKKNQKGAAGLNDRVEFIILEKEAAATN